MKTIIEENYASTVKRGLITKDTDMQDFITKIFEEVGEFEEAVEIGTLKDIKEELSDIILVCLNTAKHYGFDIEQELINKINKNKNR